ncbi:MAG: DsbA family protein [Aliidiomarina sp.]|uniref:DsbA family protein n=1 Tax=Aliidiomarina sp. TaxID=1872439 RepID=UPI0025C60848|nr:DsbA family protein [Aliidiomarina sp.]MCH8500709.1 DsbA family protein [Aliidiomarina sp.]
MLLIRNLSKFTFIAFMSLFLAACSEAPVPSAESPATGSVAPAYAEGTYYRVLAEPVQQDQQEPFIVEYLWVGCPACQNFESIMQGVKAALPDVTVVRRHGAFNQRWAFDGALFHAIQSLTDRDIATEMLAFYASQNNQLPDLDQLTGFMARLGLDPNDVFAQADSDEVEQILRQTLSEMSTNEIQGVPAVVVNGRYLLASPLPNDIRTQDDYNALIEYLLSL